MRAFMVFFIFSCSRSARCAIRISPSDTCARHQRSLAWTAAMLPMRVDSSYVAHGKERQTQHIFCRFPTSRLNAGSSIRCLTL